MTTNETELRKPAFSVVIPTYNRAKALKRCLDSLVDQTFKNFEVLVCDDGSSDNTQDIVETFTGKLNLTYLWSPNWGGPARPRNIGIQKANAPWVCFLDSDDWWYDNKLEVCSRYIENFDIIHHDVNAVIDEYKVGKRIKSRDLSDAPHFELLSNGNTLATSSTCVRTEVLRGMLGFSEEKELVAVEDYDLWLRIARAGYRFKHVPEALSAYWMGGDNISRRDAVQIKRIEAVYERHLKYLSDKEAKLAGYMKSYYVGKIYYDMGNFAVARSHFKQSLKLNNKEYKFKSLLFGILSLWKK